MPEPGPSPPAAPTLSDLDLTDAGLPGQSANLHAVLGVPAGDGPWPAVVLVHEIFGIDEVMRRQVERVAQAGYLAIMPDLFSQGGARRCLVGTFRAISAGHAFLDDSEVGPKLLRPFLRRFLGIGPDPEAAADAWERIETFLGEYLRE